MDRLDPVIVGGGLKLSLIHLVPPALGSVLKSVCVCLCACVCACVRECMCSCVRVWPQLTVESVEMHAIDYEKPRSARKGKKMTRSSHA